MAVTPYHLDPSRADELPYTPIIVVDLPGVEMIYLSGMSPLPLYHSHPHIKEETMVPDDIEEQTRRAANKIKEMLASRGATMQDVVKITRYITDPREMPAISKVLASPDYFGDWKPVSTTVGVNTLSAPGSRVELDVVAVKST